MIVCPNCNHQNPDGAIQCEACYTPLPAMLECPSCGASVQSDASFCGQCGASLNAVRLTNPSAMEPASNPVSSAESMGASVSSLPDLAPDLATSPDLGNTSGMETMEEVDIPELNIPDVDIPDVDIPDLSALDPMVEAEPLTPLEAETGGYASTAPMGSAGHSANSGINSGSEPESALSQTPTPSSPGIPDALAHPASPTPPTFKPTRIQTQALQLIHTHTNTILEVPPHLNVVHIGKPNDRVPPDIDVSGFKDSEVVSRLHADIRVEGDSYYIEDVGSSNGTYINNIPLAPGNRHKLRSGDRIALGKGDKVSFLVQLS